MAELICKMPEEMTLQFLSRLPPKSLMRFKCIHKSWYALINNPKFIDKHLHLYNKDSYTCFLLKRSVVARTQTIKEEILFSFLYAPNHNDDEDSHPHCVVEDIYFPTAMGLKTKGHNIELPGSYGGETIYILGHCDGIICLVYHSGGLVFYNPSIREFKIIPPSCLTESFSCVGGFGYDPKCKDYKVVNIVPSGEDSYDHNQRLVIYPPRAEVYTLGTDSWRQIKIDYLETETTSFWPDIYQMCYKGVFYWLGHEQDKEYLCYYDRLSSPSIRDVILLYDTGEEVFRTRLLPDSFKDLGLHALSMSLTVWNGSIALFGFTYWGPDIESFKIWMMDDFGSWTKHLTYETIMGIYLSLVLWRSDDVVMVANDGRIVSYSLSRDRVRYFPIQGVWGTYQAFVCVNSNSIVSVKGGNKVESRYI
ncbi:putative F-box protein At3g24700 [Rosa rugosa]|uniref:putative F-box protein At3g24700 n=1 Tax=Rosa rugosa TaxID=74645 RepID=UPI002B40D1F9|nr:putative F-box protein At3g24700 [Rosa rugosa]